MSPASSASNSHFVRLVGRVTPCAPVPGRLRANGAHGVTRPSAPARALTWRGGSPRQAEASPACDRRLLRRGDTGWGAAGGELPVRNKVSS
jgi:hypothetical protein